MDDLQREPAGSSATAKVLVVDDSDDTRDMMAKLLELESFGVVTAQDGLDALKIASYEQPDLIITDVNMPNLNGIEMIRELRKRPGFRRVPVIAITAYGNGVAKEALEAGADGAATKPVKFSELVDLIRRLLASSRSSGN